MTWREMVEARLLANYRECQVPVQRLRPAIVRLREEFGPYPLATAAPFLDVAGRELVQAVQEEVGLERELQLVVVRSGQLVLTDQVEDFRVQVEYEDDKARRMRPESRTPGIVMDPAFSFGRPAVRNVRTESLAEDYRAGTSRDQLADLYELASEQVEEALRFEMIHNQHAS
nr:DUF433 domain-containing protein [Actinomycetales bacterium]